MTSSCESTFRACSGCGERAHAAPSGIGIAGSAGEADCGWVGGEDDGVEADLGVGVAVEFEGDGGPAGSVGEEHLATVALDGSRADAGEGSEVPGMLVAVSADAFAPDRVIAARGMCTERRNVGRALSPESLTVISSVPTVTIAAMHQDWSGAAVGGIRRSVDREDDPALAAKNLPMLLTTMLS